MKAHRDERGRLLPGTPGIRGAGRPPKRETDARKALARGLYQELRDDFMLFGAEAIQRVREERPEAYLKVIASLAPKHLHLDGAEVTFVEILQVVEKRARDAALDEHTPKRDSLTVEGTFTLPPLPDDPLDGIGS